jgi:medium-chain acyl-[acyl-carrier-protein] hydrolase
MLIKPQTDKWIRVFKPEKEARLRLFCFPYAGGSASIYLKWPLLLSPLIEVCAVELPGRGDRLREPPFTNMPALVRTLVEIFSSWSDKPFAFFGHSMGGVIAYELACALQREAKPLPLHLFVSGCGKPGRATDKPIRYNLPEPQFLQALRELGGTPVEVFDNAELLELLMPILRADFQLIEEHQAAETALLNCPITGLCGREDLEIPIADVEMWDETSAREFSLRVFQGDHFFIKSNETLVVNTVLQTLAQLYPYGGTATCAA